MEADEGDDDIKFNDEKSFKNVPMIFPKHIKASDSENEV